MSSIDHNFEIEAEPQMTRGARLMLREGWFSSMSVRGKLNFAMMASSVILALVCLLIVAGTFMLGEGGARQAILSSIETRSNNAAIALVDAGEGLEAAEAATSDGARAAALAQAASALELAHEAILDPITYAGEDMPAEVGPRLDRYLASVEQLQAGVRDAGADPSAISGLRAETRTLYDDISQFAIGYHGEVKAGADELFANIGTMLVAFVVLLLVGIVISQIGTRHIIRDITGVMRAVTKSMDRIAEGATETSIPGGERKDEIGSMARSLEVFRTSLLELRRLTDARANDAEQRLSEQQELSEQMRALRLEKSRLLEGLADGFEVSVGELITAVSAASEQLKATSKQMVELSDESHQQAGGASAAMDKATANVTAAAAATDEFALSIGEISRQASSSAELARGASKLVSSANTRMSDLSHSADEIGEIAELIQTIAQRTNLLALNASIEAARGGEAGRGFAVVASEVKELAMQTSNATNSVTEKIAAMQASTRSSASDLGGIVDTIGELEQAAVMIASAVDQQSVSGEELARNIDTVATGAGQVNSRLEALKIASEETGNAADDVVASANALGMHSGELRDKASRFIEDVRRSARELEAGDQGDARAAI